MRVNESLYKIPLPKHEFVTSASALINMLFQGQVQSHLVFYKVDQVGELYTKSVVC